VGTSISPQSWASSSAEFRATMFNEALSNMNVLSSFISSSYPSPKSSGQDIYAAFFTSLKNALNSIS